MSELVDRPADGAGIAVAPTEEPRRAGARSARPRRTVLCSLGAGTHGTLAQIATPSLQRFAARHGYDLELGDRPIDPERPVSWSKIPLIRRLLDAYDSVVWVDGDAVVDSSRDIVDDTPDDRFLWMTMHHYDGAEQPNAGVLVVHAGDEASRFLDEVWRSEHLIEHPWWEQAAILELLGYDVSVPGQAIMGTPTPWFERVGWLSTEWNSIVQDPHPNPRIRHYPGIPFDVRLATMTRDARVLVGSDQSGPALPRVSIVLPLGDVSVEQAFVSLASLAASSQDVELVLVDDASGLEGVMAAVSGDVRVVRHRQPLGVGMCWADGVQAATGDVVVLLDGPVVLDQRCVAALVRSVGTEGAVATATAVGDGALAPWQASVLACARRDAVLAGLPLAVRHRDAIGDLCLRLARLGRRVVPVVDAVAAPPAAMGPSAPPVEQPARWALTMARAAYATTLDGVPTREELPAVLEARGLRGVGVEVGVQTGLFSHHLLAHWGGRRLVSIDPWEAAPPDDYHDVANVDQATQDARYAETLQRLAVFGDRSQVLRARSIDAAGRFADASLDFVYLDARHDHASVTADLHAWVPKVRPGGIVAGHDYLDGELPEGTFGVQSAVDAYFGALGAAVAATTMDLPWRSWLVAVPVAGWSRPLPGRALPTVRTGSGEPAPSSGIVVGASAGPQG